MKVWMTEHWDKLLAFAIAGAIVIAAHLGFEDNQISSVVASFSGLGTLLYAKKPKSQKKFEASIKEGEKIAETAKGFINIEVPVSKIQIADPPGNPEEGSAGQG